MLSRAISFKKQKNFDFKRFFLDKDLESSYTTRMVRESALGAILFFGGPAREACIALRAFLFVE